MLDFFFIVLGPRFSRNLLGEPGLVPSLVLSCLSKQIKGVRGLRDGVGCFYVLPQAAVAPIGLEEGLMGLKHPACSQTHGHQSALSFTH